jgi:hypothetical protein
MKKALIAIGLVVVIGIAVMWARQRARPDFTNSTETRRVDSYDIVAYKDGAYTIEHRGHRITAKCRNSLSWPNGLGTFGAPMDDHECIYMSSLVGKTIGEDLMKRWKDTLVYSPWEGVKTVQTADYLDITEQDGVALSTVAPQQPVQGAPAHPQTAREYFTELRDANSFNMYSDKYVCFPDEDQPSFAIVAAVEDTEDEMVRAGNTEGAKTVSKAGSGLFVRTYYKGVASGEATLYDKVGDGEYRIDYDAPLKHGRSVYLINWATGRYRLQVYALDYNKNMPAGESSGKCELIHSGDTPSIAGEPKTR